MGRKARLDKATIVQAAAELVNREGAGALSLHQLAAQLGVQTPSLYNHIDGLPGLQRELALFNAQLIAERFTAAAIGKAGSAAIRALSHAYRAYIQEYAGLYLATLRAGRTLSPVPTALIQAEERTLVVGLAVMASFGLQGEDAIHALRVWRSAIHGFATLEIAGGFGIALDCDASFDQLIELFLRGVKSPTR